MVRALRAAFVWMVCLAVLSGCVVYEPVPAYYPAVSAPGPTFDRAWNAALGAVNDTGVQVAFADPATGIIRGVKDRTDLLVTVARQANGTIQVEIEAKSPQGRDAGLAARISQAYQRRMGL